MAQALPNGTTLQDGKYKIVGFLGQGGFGITYLAENTMLDKKVAIKEFFPKDFCNREDTSSLRVGTESNRETVEKLKERFLKEARNIAKIDFSGVVKIFDIFKENNTSYYVMEYIEGENLNEIVKKNGPLSEDKAIKYIKGVGEALDHIHSKNMTHFDVKPSNIVIRKSDNKPILIDFGLSKQYNKEGEATSTLLQGISKGYSPIELYNVDENLTFSPQTDVYSLAATLYYLLEGENPPSAPELIQRKLNFPIKLSDTLQMIIIKCMSNNYKERYKNIKIFFNSFNDKIKDNDRTYIENKKVPEDNYDIETISHLKEKAEGGDLDSQIKLAELYYEGKKIPRDFFKAFELFLKAAQIGNAKAMYYVGMMYKNGDGIAQDYVMAKIWFERASLKGNPEAIYTLAIMYKDGVGIEKNYEEAIKWFLMISDNNYKSSTELIADIYYEQNDLKNAIEWYQKAVDHGNFVSMVKIGKIYEMEDPNNNIIKNYNKAVSWFIKAKNNGYNFEEDNDFATENLKLILKERSNKIIKRMDRILFIIWLADVVFSIYLFYSQYHGQNVNFQSIKLDIENNIVGVCVGFFIVIIIIALYDFSQKYLVPKYVINKYKKQYPHDPRIILVKDIR